MKGMDIVAKFPIEFVFTSLYALLLMQYVHISRKKQL